MLNAQTLRSLVEYDPTTGLFTALVQLGPRAVGSHVGSVSQGYRNIGLLGKRYGSGRLAWLYMTGEWPSAEIDHRNGNSTDDRWVNLRLATRSQNCANRRPWSASGLKGVTWNNVKLKWHARIRVNRRLQSLGYHDTPEAAHAAYQAASVTRFGEFARAA